MNKGTVKWFNAEKDTDLSQVKTEKTYLYISQQSTEKVSKLSKKVRQYLMI